MSEDNKENRRKTGEPVVFYSCGIIEGYFPLSMVQLHKNWVDFCCSFDFIDACVLSDVPLESYIQFVIPEIQKRESFEMFGIDDFCVFLYQLLQRNILELNQERDSFDSLEKVRAIVNECDKNVTVGISHSFKTFLVKGLPAQFYGGDFSRGLKKL